VTVLAMALVTWVASGVQVAGAETTPQFYSNAHLLKSEHLATTIWGEFKLKSEALGEGPEAEIHCKNVLGSSLWNEGGRGYGLIEGWGTNACKAPALEKLLETVYKKTIESGRIKSPITVFATAELPLEKELREGEVCAEEKETKLSECPKEEERENKLIVWHVRRAVTSLPWKLELVKALREEETVNVARIGVPPAGKTCYPKETYEEEGEVLERPAKWQAVPAGCVRINVVAPQIPNEVVFYGQLEPRFHSGAGNGLNASALEFGFEEPTKLQAEKGEAPESSVSGSLKIAGAESEQLIRAK
jgi:hypothetical protein